MMVSSEGDEVRRIALVTFSSDTSLVPEFDVIRELVVPQRIEYCKKHSYLHWYHYGSNYSVGYYAIQRLQYVLDRFRTNEADTVWILNLAAVITNLSTPIECYCTNGVSIVRDPNGLNAGSMILSNTIVVRAWLQTVIEEALLTDHAWYEQHIIQRLEYYSDFYDVLPSPSINQYRYSLYGWSANAQDWKPGDLVIHFPGLPLAQRIELVRQSLAEVIS